VGTIGVLEDISERKLQAERAARIQRELWPARPPALDGYDVAGACLPAQEVAGDLYDWALSQAKGAEAWRDSTPLEWDAEVARFFAALRRFDDYLASDAPLAAPIEKIFQGAIADSLTHVGQLAMLRRLAGARIKGENYAKADIAAGRVGPEQTAPRREF